VKFLGNPPPTFCTSAKLCHEYIGQTLQIGLGSVAKNERRTDKYLSTSRRAIEAVNGELRSSPASRTIPSRSGIVPICPTGRGPNCLTDIHRRHSGPKPAEAGAYFANSRKSVIFPAIGGGADDAEAHR
jgi:hypothetical protein